MEWVLRGFLLAAIVAVTVFLFVAGWRRFQEFQQFREREVQLVERISAQRTEFARQQEYHRRLLNRSGFPRGGRAGPLGLCAGRGAALPLRGIGGGI